MLFKNSREYTKTYTPKIDRKDSSSGSIIGWYGARSHYLIQCHHHIVGIVHKAQQSYTETLYN